MMLSLDRKIQIPRLNKFKLVLPRFSVLTLDKIIIIPNTIMSVGWPADTPKRVD